SPCQKEPQRVLGQGRIAACRQSLAMRLQFRRSAVNLWPVAIRASAPPLPVPAPFALLAHLPLLLLSFAANLLSQWDFLATRRCGRGTLPWHPPNLRRPCSVRRCAPRRRRCQTIGHKKDTAFVRAAYRPSSCGPLLRL